ncbi:MAG: prepilin-type N-terminal cleavage/methylation domain-containing protein [Nitrospiraceae bacterium]|nr:prepilin-type N-terminal cleavage/methylation domain-containing protein [Nitrospiraceae bacterium]
MKQRIRGRIKLNFRSGFTLIEVFVVLVIVSLFISIHQ